MCVMCSTSVPTLFQYFFYDHIPTFLYIFHEMFFITCVYRDVNRPKKYQNKVGMLSSHITHTLDPYHSTNRNSAMRSEGCVLCSYSIPTLF